MAREWSKYQVAIFKDVECGKGHTVVQAYAGSGKTTSMIEALCYVPKGLTVLMVAFNKSIAKELQARAPEDVEVATLHSFGFRAVNKSLGRQQVNQYRVHGLAEEMHGDAYTTSDLRYALVKAVSLAKSGLLDRIEQIDALIDAFAIDMPDEHPRVSAKDVDDELELAAQIRLEFCRDVLVLMEQCKQVKGEIDFDDMVWLPVVLNLRVFQYDRVFADEFQDLGVCQIELVLKACKKNGRICVIGDRFQAIYAFRGADAAAMDRARDRLDAKVLPLSVCYRCGRKIIELVQQTVPGIEAAPNAPDGSVEYVTSDDMIKKAAPGEFILSRSNAPLVSLCMRFLAEGRRAHIQGRDIGSRLKGIVARSKSENVEELRTAIDSWERAETKRLLSKKPPRDTQQIEDMAMCLMTLSESAKSVSDVISRIDELFADNDDTNRIVLSTTHKAKGLQRDRVWVLAGTYRRRVNQEETNLWYVATSRAQSTLCLVSGFEPKKKDWVKEEES